MLLLTYLIIFVSLSGLHTFDLACLYRGECVALALHKPPVVLKSNIEYDSLVAVEVRKHGVEI